MGHRSKDNDVMPVHITGILEVVGASPDFGEVNSVVWGDDWPKLTPLDISGNQPEETEPPRGLPEPKPLGRRPS